MAMSTLLPVAHSIPPSKNNTMDPDQRTRLLRNARKLEALLGTTPQVVGSNDFLRARPTKTRRKNEVYISQFSSSASSLDSTSSEKEHTGRTRPDVRDVFSGGSPSSITSLPSRDKANCDRKTNRTRGGRQPLAQPLLLRMSAVPVDHHRRQSTSSIPAKVAVSSIPPRHTKPVLASIPAPPLVTPFERRKLKVDSVLGPLSPINKYHFPAGQYSHSRSHSDLDPPLTPPALTGLSDREKRIKMAKVQRMMGENIPPELVFRETTRTADKTEKRLRRRSRSMSAIRNGTATGSSPLLETPVERKSKGKGKEIDTARPIRPLPTVPTSNNNTTPRSLPPTPAAPIITQTTTTTTSSPLIRQFSLSMKQKGRKSRPRSLTLGTASAFVAANIKLAQQEKEVVETAEKVRGTVSLDESRHCRNTRNDENNSSERDKAHGRIVERPDAPFTQEKERIGNSAFFRTEIWKRNEREWVGEWNIQDMDEVAKALRGLRST